MPKKMAKKAAATAAGGLGPVVIRPGVEIYHGDALAVLAQLAPDSADMIFTDPPYGHNDGDGDLKGIRARAGLPNARGRPLRTIMNDGPEANDLFRAALPLMRRILAHGCCCCCCGGGGPDPMFAKWSMWLDEVFRFKQMVVWDKGWGLGWHYHRCYETILVAEVPGKCRWYGHKSVKNIIRVGEYGIHKVVPTDDQHPTEKPPELSKAFIIWHSRRGDLVVDPFMGGGSTGLAAMRLGRRFIGIESDRQWFDKAEKKLRKEADEQGRK